MRSRLLVVALILVWLFRGRLLEMVTTVQERICLPALLVAAIGATIVFFSGYILVTGMQLRTVRKVAYLITFGGILVDYLGHWLATFPIFCGDFWGGVITGALETALLWGGLYGAKEVWTGERE